MPIFWIKTHEIHRKDSSSLINNVIQRSSALEKVLIIGQKKFENLFASIFPLIYVYFHFKFSILPSPCSGPSFKHFCKLLMYSSCVILFLSNIRFFLSCILREMELRFRGEKDNEDSERVTSNKWKKFFLRGLLQFLKLDALAGWWKRHFLLLLRIEKVFVEKINVSLHFWESSSCTSLPHLLLKKYIWNFRQKAACKLSGKILELD